MALKGERAIATLHIRGVPQMTPEGVKDIADWLRKQAAALEEEGISMYSARFRARYLVTEEQEVD